MGRRTRRLIILILGFPAILFAGAKACPDPIESLFSQAEIEKILSRKINAVPIIRKGSFECRYGSLKIGMTVRKSKKAPVSHIEAQKATCRDALDCIWEEGFGDGMWHSSKGKVAEAFCGDFSIFIESGASQNQTSLQVIKLMKGKTCPPAPVEEVVVQTPKVAPKLLKVNGVKFRLNGKQISRDKLPAGSETTTCESATRFAPITFAFEVAGENLKGAEVAVGPGFTVLDLKNSSDKKISGQMKTEPSVAQGIYDLSVSRGSEIQKVQIGVEISGTQYLVFHAKKFAFPLEFVGNWPNKPYEKEEKGVAEIPRIETNLRLGMDEISGEKYKALNLSFRAFSEECWKSRMADTHVDLLTDLPVVDLPIKIAKTILNQSARALLKATDKAFSDKWNEIVNPPPKKHDPLSDPALFVETVVFDPARASEALKENDIAFNKKLKLLKEYGFLR